jgi:hypothetical protein
MAVEGSVEAQLNVADDKGKSIILLLPNPTLIAAAPAEPEALSWP